MYTITLTYKLSTIVQTYYNIFVLILTIIKNITLFFLKERQLSLSESKKKDC